MKRKSLFLSFGFFIFFIFLTLPKFQVVLADAMPSFTPESFLSFTPTQTATLTITPTYTSTPTITPTSTITLTPTATYDASKLYPVQDDNSNTQTQLENIQDAISKLQEYIKTSQPDNSQIQKALDAITDSLAITEQEAKIDKLKQNIVGWIQFSLGLILGAFIGWVNIEPPLPTIRRDLIVKTIKGIFSRKPIDKKTKRQPENRENNKGIPTINKLPPPEQDFHSSISGVVNDEDKTSSESKPALQLSIESDDMDIPKFLRKRR